MFSYSTGGLRPRKKHSQATLWVVTKKVAMAATFPQGREVQKEVVGSKEVVAVSDVRSTLDKETWMMRGRGGSPCA